MITGELKNKIDNLWDIFASGGLVNPLEVIEQITYLMFIHDLDDSDNTRAKESAMLGLPYQSIFSEEVKIGERTISGNQLKWSVFHDFPADRMYSVMQEWVFPFIKTLHSDKNSAYSKYMDDAIFKLPTPLVLSKVVDSLDEIYAVMNEIQTTDVRGDVYEYLLSKIAQSGRNGQFRTPRHIIRMMVELMDPSSDEIICDPACGTSGFLVVAGGDLKEKKKEETKIPDIRDIRKETMIDELLEERREKTSYYDTREHDWISEQEMGSSIMRETDNLWMPVKRFLNKHKKSKWGDWDGLHIEEEEL